MPLNTIEPKIYISKLTYSEIIEIIGETEQSIIYNELNYNFKAKKNGKNKTMPKERLKSYINFEKPSTEQIKNLTVEDIEVGSKLLPNHLIILQEESLRIVTFIGEDFYLYTNHINQELKDSVENIKNFQKITINQKELSPEKDLAIKLYNSAKKQILQTEALENLFSRGIELINIQNKVIKDSFNKVLKYNSKKFDDKTFFCLQNSIPVVLSDDQLKLFSDNKINMKIAKKEEKVSSGMFLDYSDENEVQQYDDLYIVKMFTKNDVSQEIKDLIEEKLAEINF